MKFKNVLIFGASRGIGKALAIRYSRIASKLVITSRNINLLSELAGKIKCFYIKCDISEKQDVSNAVSFAIDKLNTIDLVIINSGLGGPNWLDNFSSEELKAIYSTNVFGIAHVFEFIIPFMTAQGYGTIACVSSLADVRGFPGSSAYSSSKAGASAFLEAARIELKPKNIRVVTVRPGFVRTDMTAKNEFRMPFIMSPEKAAMKIIKGIEDGKTIVNFPLPLVFITTILRLLPSWLYERLIRNARSKMRN